MGTMQAWVIRPERLGDPVDAMQLETIDVPDPGPGEVLVRVMAAGVNYNGVWASLGLPVSLFRCTGTTSTSRGRTPPAWSLRWGPA